MTQRFYIHPDNPQARLIKQAGDILRQGGVVVYPTDTSYALACHMGDKAALDRIRALRRLDDNHHFTLLCRNLNDIGDYARVDNQAYRLIKHLTPGPYTFIFKATKEVPRRLLHPKQKTVGLRVPENPIAHALLEEMAEPLMTTTLILPGETQPLTDPDDIYDRLQRQVDLIIDGGHCGLEVTTLVDMVSEPMTILRQGKGMIDEWVTE